MPSQNWDRGRDKQQKKCELTGNSSIYAEKINWLDKPESNEGKQEKKKKESIKMSRAKRNEAC